MAATWEHVDVFPVIARNIEERFAILHDFVTHDELVASLLADPEGAALIAGAQLQKDSGHTLEWIAHNMVAWFSQRFTIGESHWLDRLDRIKINEKWAYKPK